MATAPTPTAMLTGRTSRLVASAGSCRARCKNSDRHSRADFASQPGNGSLCGDDFRPLDDGAPDAGVPYGGDTVAALVDGHADGVFMIELDACTGSEQEDKPGLVVPGQASGCRVEASGARARRREYEVLSPTREPW